MESNNNGGEWVTVEGRKNSNTINHDLTKNKTARNNTSEKNNF
jgi:hypothetical protein